jgi:hypothetical protein
MRWLLLVITLILFFIMYKGVLRSHRWIFWLYMILATPTALAMFVFKIGGDTNGLMWLFGTLMWLLSIPWIFLSAIGVGPQGMPFVGLSIVGNAILLWWLTRSKTIVHSSKLA